MQRNRSLAALAAAVIFQWLVSTGIVDLSNPIVTRETLEAGITTILLIAAALLQRCISNKKNKEGK